MQHDKLHFLINSAKTNKLTGLLLVKGKKKSKNDHINLFELEEKGFRPRSQKHPQRRLVFLAWENAGSDFNKAFYCVQAPFIPGKKKQFLSNNRAKMIESFG